MPQQHRAPAMPTASDDWWDRMNGTDLLGLAPGGSAVPAAGQALPLSTTGYGDHVAQWWHPDSPHFWTALLIGGTGLLIIGASFRVQAGVGKETAAAGASVGRTKEK